MGPTFWIPFGYAWTSLLFYFMISGIILLHRQVFRSSYYKLFLVSAVINVFTYINSLVILRYPVVCCKDCFLSSIYSSGYFFGLEVFIMFLQYFGLAQYSISIAVAVNRFTTVTLPLSYDKLWNRIFLPVVVITLLLPLVLAFPGALYPGRFIYNSDVDAYRPQTDYPAKTVSLVGTLFQSLCTIICLVINLGTVLLLFRKRSAYSGSNSTEMRLFLHSLLNFMAELFATTLMAIIFFAPIDSPESKMAYSLIPYCSDALTFISPYILILCSSDLQKMLFRRNGTKTPIMVSVVTASTRR